MLGVSPLEKFDMVKAAYAKRKKEAEMKGDEATASRVGRLFLFFPFFFLCEMVFMTIGIPTM